MKEFAQQILAAFMKEKESSLGDRLENKVFASMETSTLKPTAANMQQELLAKHYLRKHGKNTYYGQK